MTDAALRSLRALLVVSASLLADAEAGRLAPPEPEFVESTSGRRFYPTGVAHLDTALAYVGVREARPNRGPEVDRFTRSVGLRPPIYWCAAFTSYVRRAAAEATGVEVGPFEASGRPHYGAVATRHLTFGGAVRASAVWRGAASVPPGALVVWRSGRSWRGHIGVVWKDDDPTDEGFAPGDRSAEARRWRHRCGMTVEGNTGDGSTRNGNGVYTRKRCISHSYFRIVGFALAEPRS